MRRATSRAMYSWSAWNSTRPLDGRKVQQGVPRAGLYVTTQGDILSHRSSNAPPRKRSRHHDKEYHAQGCKNTPYGRLLALVRSAMHNHQTRQGRKGRPPPRRRPYDITFRRLVAKYINKKGRRFYSGMPMGFSSGHDWLSSLVRVNVRESYTSDNVVLI